MNTSLIFDVRHVSKVGFLSVFAYGNELARLNKTTFEPAVMGDPTKLRESLSMLELHNINPISYTEDSRMLITPLLRQMLDGGILTKASRVMLTCTCKKVSIPEDATIRKTSTTLLMNNTASCCNSILQGSTTEVIQTNPILFTNIANESYPSWGPVEIADMRKKFVGKQLIVSKNIPTAISINVDGQKFFIDNDMFVYLSPLVSDKKPSHIVTGTSLVKQITLYTFFASVLVSGYKIPKIHFLPRVNYQGIKSLTELCTKFGPERVRQKLLKTASSGKQSIAFNDSGI